MLSSRGQYVLFADADGATKFSDFSKLEHSMQKLAPSWKEEAITIGSRAHLEEESKAKRSFFRTILMHGFHALVRIFGRIGSVRDTQCGFKLLSRSAARRIFKLMHVERW
jgi:dolichyl-phosphate beta-glucosyltransferase